eukprot:Mrub_03817.p1 GENE.Mrub_03817~~Mrub_03817.p1  ORF type:complete len:426 (+),score=52.12 Mrub_03817:136-1278(+)
MLKHKLLTEISLKYKRPNYPKKSNSLSLISTNIPHKDYIKSNKYVYDYISNVVILSKDLYPDQNPSDLSEVEITNQKILLKFLVGYEYGAIIEFQYDLTDIILSDVMNYKPKSDIPLEIKDLHFHDGKVTVLKHIDVSNYNIFLSAGYDLKLIVWKVESGQTNNLIPFRKDSDAPSSKLLTYDLPTVINYIDYKSTDGILDYIIAACYDGNIRLFTIDGDINNMTITKTIFVANYPLLQLALKDKNTWIVVGDTTNFHVIDTDTNSNKVVCGYSSLIKGVLCSMNLIVTLSEKQARVWDMYDYRLMYTIEVSNDTLNTHLLTGDYLFIGSCDMNVRWYNYSDMVNRYQNFLLMEDENKWQDAWNVKMNKAKKEKKGKKKK